MKFVIFGLTISSSWGNGHAAIWRGLVRALIERGHEVAFFERDTAYYSAHRDLATLSGAKLFIYDDWSAVLPTARDLTRQADVALTTSYCIDARNGADLMFQQCSGIKVFYDLDTPITLRKLADDEEVFYLPPRGLSDFDLVLSFTGGESLHLLRRMLGARLVTTMYAGVDPYSYYPSDASQRDLFALSYLGTYAPDRQVALEQFLLEPARVLRDRRFHLAGAQYPQSMLVPSNVHHSLHIAPTNHRSFYCSAAATLNLTRAEMARNGYCPSGRLFEAAACGVPILTDTWPGLEEFFEPGREIVPVSTTVDVLNALKNNRVKLETIGAAARDRVLREHTSMHRVMQLEATLAAVSNSSAALDEV